ERCIQHVILFLGKSGKSEPCMLGFVNALTRICGFWSHGFSSFARPGKHLAWARMAGAKVCGVGSMAGHRIWRLNRQCRLRYPEETNGTYGLAKKMLLVQAQA